MTTHSISPKLLIGVALRIGLGIPFIALIILLPGGIWNDWQGWMYLATLLLPMLVSTVYLFKNDPALLERRLRMREKKSAQQKIIGVLALYFLIAFTLPGFDVRFGWSNVPPLVSILADGLVFAGRGKGKETLYDQYDAACQTMPHVVTMIQSGWDVIVTHGNGPQVGFVLRRSEIASGELHEIPLDYCGSNTQGTIGYMFQTALNNEFQRRGMPNQAVTVITQTLVNLNDPAFSHPTKPIGSFLSEAEANVHQQEDRWNVVEDAGRGWRRVVPSPAPVRIIQQDAILELTKAGFTVVGVGGGGISMIKNKHGDYAGVEAVIDKDLASSLLASTINADLFMITTEVEKVAIHFNKPDMKWLDELSMEHARAYLAEGQFGKGSMQPKIEAVLQYLERGGRHAIITNPENMQQALEEKTGTHFHNVETSIV